MRTSDANLSETDIRPAAGRSQIVRADDSDSRSWLAQAPICPALAHYHIRHTASAELGRPFAIVRTSLAGSYFLACLGGEGRVLLDGRWKKCGSGQAVLLPPHTLQAFHATGAEPWQICWVRYGEPRGLRPLATSATPIIAHFDGEPLRWAILGLHREAHAGGSGDAMRRWVDLIDLYVKRFAAPARLDVRLWQLWNEVAQSLDRVWTVAAMAQRVHLSEKQLQRLCKRELGRNPRQQLIWLRMRRAAELLAGGRCKVEAAARQVGCKNPFVFSSTFKRVMGRPPSQYALLGGRRPAKPR